MVYKAFHLCFMLPIVTLLHPVLFRHYVAMASHGKDFILTFFFAQCKFWKHCNMPFPAKRRLANEKKNKECSNKCQKINSFLQSTNNDASGTSNTKSESLEVSSVDQSTSTKARRAPDSDKPTSSANSIILMETAGVRCDAKDREAFLKTDEQFLYESTPEQASELAPKVQSQISYKGFRLDIHSIIQKAGKDILSSFQEKGQSESKNT